MLQDIIDALKLREEQAKFAGHQVTVREMALDQDFGVQIKTDEDRKQVEDEIIYYMTVFSVLHAEGDLAGKPVFDQEDVKGSVELIKRGSKTKLAALLNVVRRVNGLSIGDDAKN